MGNLAHYNMAPGNDSPGADLPDQVAGDGYASEDFVPGSSSSRERKKGPIFISLSIYNRRL